MTPPTGSLRDWDDLIAALAAHELLSRMFSAGVVGEALGNVARAARRCGWDQDRGELFAWADRMVGRYRALTAPCTAPRPRSARS